MDQIGDILKQIHVVTSLTIAGVGDDIAEERQDGCCGVKENDPDSARVVDPVSL